MRRALVIVLLMIAVLTPAKSALAASITFNSQNVTLGTMPFLDVDLLVENLDEPVLAFLLSFAFDPGILQLQSISEGSFLSAFGPTDFDATPVSTTVPPDFQTITTFLIQGSTDPGVPGGSTGILATLRFVPVAVGDGNLSLLEAGLGEFSALRSGFVRAGGDELLEPELLSGDITISSPTPQPVPEPSTLALLGVGLAAMARKRLKKKTVA